MPPLTLSEQHHRAGSPLHQEAYCCQSVVSLRSRCREYHPRIRSNAHHSQGTDPMVTEGRYRRSGPICEPCLRVGCLIPAISPYSCPHSLICDTARNNGCRPLLSEAEPGVQLNNPSPGRIQELAEEGIVDTVPQTSQIRVVQRVEHVGADLKLQLFHQGEVLREAEVKVPETGTANDARARSARRDRGTRGRH